MSIALTATRAWYMASSSPILELTALKEPEGGTGSALAEGTGVWVSGGVLAVASSLCEARSEEHTSELQSRGHLVCRLLLEKKKKTTKHMHHIKSLLKNSPIVK